MLENLVSVLIIALVGLSVILQLATLVKITQIQNGQKHKAQNQNPAHNHGKKHGNQNQNQHKNKNQQDNRVNQNQNNNRPAQPQQQQANPNQNKQQQPQSAPEKKFEKIVSNAQPLKETNAQLANRPKPQQQGGNNNNGKPKVYSERTTPATPGVQKQERPANAPIKQQELPKSETEREEKPQPQPQQPKVEAPKVVEEVKNDDASVSYGRR